MPNGAALAGYRILVVEDNFLLAMEIEGILHRQGCLVLGPAGTVEHALALLDREAKPDLAVLDVDLQGRRVTPVAATLLSCAVPFVLVTGYRELQLDEPELNGRPHLEKPLNSKRLLRTLARLLERA